MRAQLLAALRWGMGPRAGIAIGDHHRKDVDADPNEFSEIIFVAERVDHARRKDDVLDVNDVWEQGRLSGNKDRAAAIIEDIPITK